MLNLFRITNEKQLQDYYTEDQETKQEDVHKGGGLYRVYACNKPIIFENKQEDKIICSSYWYINERNELIYQIKKNKWINLNMYEENRSYVADNIYIIEEV